jgi:hypothetical protein
LFGLYDAEARRDAVIEASIARRLVTSPGERQHRPVPTISRFYGITIQMFFKEHGVPHFHARYAGQIAVYAVETLDGIRGELPGRAERLVREWAALHREELLQNLEQARAGKPLSEIEPLK